MQVEFNKRFTKSLDKNKLLKTDDVIELIEEFLEDMNKSSFDNKHIKGCSNYKNLWQIRVNRDYRILYLKFDDYLEFRFIGSHNEVERLIKTC